MADSKRDIDIRIKLQKLDRERTLDKLAKDFGELAAETKDVERAVDSLQKELKSIGATEKEIDRVTKAFDRAAKSAASVKRPELRFDEDFSAASKRSDIFGDFDTALATFGSTTGFEGFTAVADIAALTEQFGRLDAILPNLASGVVSFVSGLSPLTLALGAVTAALAATVVSATEAGRALDAANAARIRSEADIEREIAKGLTREAAEERIAELERLYEAELNIIQNETDRIENAFNDSVEKFGGDAGGRFATAINNIFSEAEEASVTNLNEARTNSEAFRNEIEQLKKALAEGRIESEQQEDATTEATEAIKEQSRANRDVAKSAKEASDGFKRASESIRRESKTFTIGVKGSSGKASSLRSQLQDGEQSLEEILSQQVDAQLDYQQTVAELQADFDKEAIARKKRYEQELADIDEEFKDAQRNAILENDIQAAIDAERERADAVANATDEFLTSEQEAIDAFNEAINRERQVHQERLQQIEEQAAKQREANALILQQLDAIRAANQRITNIASGIGQTLGGSGFGGNTKTTGSSIFEGVATGSATYQSLIDAGYTPFADGGIVTRPTAGIVAEAGAEAIIPLDRMGGMMGGMSVNVPITLDIANLGDVVTGSKLQAFGQQLQRVTVEGVVKGLQQARYMPSV